MLYLSFFYFSIRVYEFQCISCILTSFNVFRYFQHIYVWWMSWFSTYVKYFHQCKCINLLLFFNIFQFSTLYFDVFWCWNMSFNVFQLFFNVFQSHFFHMSTPYFGGLNTWNTWNTYFNGTLFQRISTYFTRMFRWC